MRDGDQMNKPELAGKRLRGSAALQRLVAFVAQDPQEVNDLSTEEVARRLRLYGVDPGMIARRHRERIRSLIKEKRRAFARREKQIICKKAELERVKTALDNASADELTEIRLGTFGPDIDGLKLFVKAYSNFAKKKRQFQESAWMLANSTESMTTMPSFEYKGRGRIYTHKGCSAIDGYYEFMMANQHRIDLAICVFDATILLFLRDSIPEEDPRDSDPEVAEESIHPPDEIDKASRLGAEYFLIYMNNADLQRAEELKVSEANLRHFLEFNHRLRPDEYDIVLGSASKALAGESDEFATGSLQQICDYVASFSPTSVLRVDCDEDREIAESS